MKNGAYQELFDLEENYWWFIGRRRISFPLLEDSQIKTAGTQILDAGCGTGLNITYLQENLGQTFGIDISMEALRLCKKRGIHNLVRGSIDELPFKDRAFNAICCLGVIYHKGVVNVANTFSEFDRVTKRDGLILVTTPALECLRSRHDIIQDTIRRFTKKELESFVTGSGYKIIKISYWNFILFPIVYFVRKLLNIIQYLKGNHVTPPSSDLTEIPNWINSLLLSILEIEASLLKKINFPIGVSLLCIGEKSG